MAISLRQKKQKSTVKPGPKYLLQLYIAGQTPNCMIALKNLEKICDEYIQNQYQIEVIDLLLNPELAEHDQILAIPTVIKRHPLPMCKAIGNLANTELVLTGLDLCEKKPTIL